MTDKKRVIFIGATPPPHHGVTVYIEKILGSKLRNHFNIVHLDTSDHRDINNVSKLDFLNVYLALRSILQLVLKLLKHKPAIVYIPISATFLPYLRDGLFIMCAKWFSKATIMVHLHGGRYFRDEFYVESSSIIRLFLRHTLGLVDLAIVLSDRLRSIFDGLVSEVVVLQNGSDFPVVGNATKKCSKGKDIVRVGYLSNLYESKGILDLLEAFGQVTNLHEKVFLRLAGSWYDDGKNTQRRFEELMKARNLCQNVELIGFVTGEKKEEFLVATDIFVLPSWNEGFPLVILEAMAQGCPVVATNDVGAIPDIVVDGVTGILVEKQNPRELAEAITRLVEDPELRWSMGKAGRERFLSNFTMECHVNNLIEILSKIAG